MTKEEFKEGLFYKEMVSGLKTSSFLVDSFMGLAALGLFLVGLATDVEALYLMFPACVMVCFVLLMAVNRWIVRDIVTTGKQRKGLTFVAAFGDITTKTLFILMLISWFLKAS